MFILAALAVLFAPHAASADGAFTGLQIGVGSLQIAEGVHKSTGRGLTQTREGLEPGDSVIRDANNRMGAWTVGFQAGFEFPRLLSLLQLGGDIRGRYVVNAGGAGQHYFRGTPAVIGAEEADFDYYGGSVDVGARVCLRAVCLRPFVGVLASATQKFNFGSGNGFHISADENRRLLKGVQVLMRVEQQYARAEVGVEYFFYESRFGGNTSGILVTLSVLMQATEHKK